MTWASIVEDFDSFFCTQACLRKNMELPIQETHSSRLISA